MMIYRCVGTACCERIRRPESAGVAARARDQHQARVLRAARRGGAQSGRLIMANQSRAAAPCWAAGAVLKNLELFMHYFNYDDGVCDPLGVSQVKSPTFAQARAARTQFRQQRLAEQISRIQSHRAVL